MSNYYDIPVVLFTFRRLDTVQMILDRVRQVKPKTLYIFSDAARESVEEQEKVQVVREYLRKAIDWDCEKHLFFAEKNKGCDKNIREGIDNVFSEQKWAVILEDDAVPLLEFFAYCQEMLKQYEKDERIQYIAGFNAIGNRQQIQHDYTFGKTTPMSGAIATWANRWKECDFTLHDWPKNRRTKRLDSLYYTAEMRRRYRDGFEQVYTGKSTAWDFMFEYDMINKDRFAIVPKGNLATSYGYVEGAYHPQGKKVAKRLLPLMTESQRPIQAPYDAPQEIKHDIAYDKLRQKEMLSVNGNYVERQIQYGYQAVKDWCYLHLPKRTWNLIKSFIKK